MNNPFSIVIPCFNSEYDHLIALANSLEGECTDMDQIIWVDDGSKNKSGYDQLRKKLINDKKHRFFALETNCGVACAINYGISFASKNSYIITMGSDDLFSKNYIQRAREVFDSYQCIDIVVPQIEQIGARRGKVDPLLRRGLNIFKFFKKNRIFAASAFRRSIWEEVGGFNENLRGSYEDWDFWFRCAIHGASFYELNAVGYCYRIRKSSLSFSIDSERAKKNLRKQWILLLITAFFKNPILLLKNIKTRVYTSKSDLIISVSSKQDTNSIS